jgi:ABC-type transport system involved in multi-copper enzyme maturation permease subunit
MTEMTLDPAVQAPDPPELPADPVSPPPADSRATRTGRRTGNLFAGLSAIAVKELRGRMRGRRAFVNVTLFLLIVGGFAWMVELMAERSLDGGFGSAGQSAAIGRTVFAALVMLETFLHVMLTPPFTAGAISLEREKQTIDQLVVTPISSVAIVLGKLLAALVFVGVLIATSIPFTAVVFVFGGVAPDDIVRSYVVMVAAAIVFSSLGIFFSALLKRTQLATVVTYLAVLALTFGALFTWGFWTSMTSGGNERFGPLAGSAPEWFVYANPAIAQADVLCGTETGFEGWCSIVGTFTNRPIFGGSTEFEPPMPAPDVGVVAVPRPLGVAGDVAIGGASDGPELQRPALAAAQPFGIDRDALWPRMVAVWLGMSSVLVIGAIQLVGPRRRPRIGRPFVRRPGGGT